MSNIKTWEDRRSETDKRIGTVSVPLMLEEIVDLRAALAKAEGERDALREQFDLSIGAIESHYRTIETLADENRALQAKLKALEGQEPVASFDEQSNTLFWTNYDKMKWPHGTCQATAIPSWRTKLFSAAGAAPVPEGWIVAKQHAYEVREGDKKQLGYLVPEGMVVFPSFTAASEFIAECGLPLGWVYMKVSQLMQFPAAPRSAS